MWDPKIIKSQAWAMKQAQSRQEEGLALAELQGSSPSPFQPPEHGPQNETPQPSLTGSGGRRLLGQEPVLFLLQPSQLPLVVSLQFLQQLLVRGLHLCQAALAGLLPREQEWGGALCWRCCMPVPSLMPIASGACSDPPVTHFLYAFCFLGHTQ